MTGNFAMTLTSNDVASKIIVGAIGVSPASRVGDLSFKSAESGGTGRKHFRPERILSAEAPGYCRGSNGGDHQP